MPSTDIAPESVRCPGPCAGPTSATLFLDHLGRNRWSLVEFVFAFRFVMMGTVGLALAAAAFGSVTRSHEIR